MGILLFTRKYYHRGTGSACRYRSNGLDLPANRIKISPVIQAALPLRADSEVGAYARDQVMQGVGQLEGVVMGGPVGQFRRVAVHADERNEVVERKVGEQKWGTAKTRTPAAIARRVSRESFMGAMG